MATKRRAERSAPRTAATDGHPVEPAAAVRQPLRTCVGCRTRLPQAAMVRCVLDAEGVATASRTASGRGAWLCSLACFTVAVKRKGFERAWRRPVTVGALDELHGQISNLFESTPAPTRHR